MMMMMIADYHLYIMSATSTISKANQHEICFNQDHQDDQENQERYHQALPLQER